MLWKDVRGILTADPRLVPDARLIPQLHHREAAEVAHYGAKVLHPRALIPIAGTRIVLHVRSFLDPEAPGTEVSARRSMATYPVKALAIVRGQAIVTVAGKGMVGVHGIAARTFAAVEAERLSVSTIFQASSESSIGFTLAESEARPRGEQLAARVPRRALERPDRQRHRATRHGRDRRRRRRHGRQPRHRRARVLGARDRRHQRRRDRAGIVGAQHLVRGRRRTRQRRRRAASTRRFSCRRSAAAVRPRRRGPTSCSSGSAASAARWPIRSPRRPTASPPVRVVGLLDRSGYVFEPRGISRRRLLQLTREKDGGALLSALGGKPASAADALTFMAGHAVSRPVIVDVTSDETDDLLRAAVGHGFDIVLANKKPLAGSWSSYERLLGSIDEAGREMRYEATVGAGLPIIDTYHKLVETGDRVLRIEGSRQRHADVRRVGGLVRATVLAGGARGRGARVCRAGSARRSSGRDAARKALILARLLGYRGPAPVADDLVPRSLKKVPAADFLDRLTAFDDEWAARAAAEARTWTRAALRGDGDAAHGLGEACGSAGVEPDGRARGHAQSGGLHDAAVSHRAARDQRAWRRRRSHGGGHPERHLLAVGAVM